MVLPSKKEIEDMQTEMRELIGLPDNWDVDIKVEPYLFYDMKYEIKHKQSTIEIMVYSGTFPESYRMWYKNVAIEIANKLSLTPSPKAYGA
jgi:hypothetical protein